MKGTQQHRKLKRFARTARRCTATKKIKLVGPQACSKHGLDIYGVTGQQLQRIRQRLGAVAGSGRKGECLTALLDIRAPGRDPGITLPSSCIKTWLD
eukprot:3354398-Pyramimonas_sp.AAC.1